MSVSKGIHATSELIRDAKEILIPYPVAKSRYGVGVAAIVEQLNDSSASEAKDKEPDKFKWYLTYTNPKDPQTTDENEFVRLSTEATRVFLLCRGFRWRGAVELEGDLPEQIRSRFEQRARLMCSPEVPIVEPDDQEDVLGPKDMRQSPLEQDVNQILLSLSGLASKHSVDTGYIRIAEMALKNLKHSGTKRIS